MATALKYVGTALPSCLAVREAVADFLDADLVRAFFGSAAAARRALSILKIIAT